MLSGRRIGLQRGLRNRRSDLRSNNRQTHTHVRAHHTRRTMRVPNLRHWKIALFPRPNAVADSQSKNNPQKKTPPEQRMMLSVAFAPVYAHTQKPRGPKSRKNKSKAQARPTKIGQRAQPNPRQPRAFCGFCVTVIANSTATATEKKKQDTPPKERRVVALVGEGGEGVGMKDG